MLLGYHVLRSSWCFNVARLAKDIKTKRDLLQDLYTDLLDQQQESCSEEVLSMLWPHLLEIVETVVLERLVYFGANPPHKCNQKHFDILGKRRTSWSKHTWSAPKLMLAWIPLCQGPGGMCVFWDIASCTFNNLYAYNPFCGFQADQSHKGEGQTWWQERKTDQEGQGKERRWRGGKTKEEREKEDHQSGERWWRWRTR